MPTPIYPKDIYEKLGISRTQYYEGFKELIKMGYIVPEDYLTFYARRQSPKLDQYYNQDYIVQGEKDYPYEGTKEIYCIFNNSTAMDIIKRLKSYPAIQLWFFFIANKQGYEFYLSPSYVKKQISLPESSYHKGIHILIDNGFLVQQTQCYYIFEEEGNGDYQVFGEQYAPSLENCEREKKEQLKSALFHTRMAYIPHDYSLIKQANGLTGIYKIEDKLSKKIYIGQSINIGQRWMQHIRGFKNRKPEGLHKNYPFLKLENLEFSIIELCDKTQLNSCEIYWIDYFDSYHQGLNKTLGGQGKHY